MKWPAGRISPMARPRATTRDVSLKNLDTMFLYGIGPSQSSGQSAERTGSSNAAVQEPIEEEGHHNHGHWKAQHRPNEMIAPPDCRHGQCIVQWRRRLENQPQQRDRLYRMTIDLPQQTLDQRTLRRFRSIPEVERVYMSLGSGVERFTLTSRVPWRMINSPPLCAEG